MNQIHLTAFLASLSLLGCSSSADIEQAQRSVTDKLSDPLSAQFRNVKSFGDGVVCGEYNAKNKLGGYVGFKAFTYGPRVWEASMTPTAEDIEALCTNEPDRRKLFLTHKLKQLEPGCSQTAPMPGTPCAEVWDARQELNGIVFKQR